MIAHLARAIDCPADIVQSLHELQIVDSAHFALVDIDTVLAMANRRHDQAAKAHLEKVNRENSKKKTLNLIVFHIFSFQLFRVSLEVNAPRVICAMHLLPQRTMRISTGAASLDALLDNGVLRGHVVELYGASGAGASILAHSIAVNAAISRGVALWLDSGNKAFSAVRTLALVRRALTFRAKSDADELARDDQAAAEVLLSRMLVSVVVDAFALVRALRQVADAPAPASERPPLRLLIVDSLGALMSPLVSMPGAQAVGQATIALVARLLKAIAVEQNAVVLIVNYALQDGQPALGRAWRYVANERILLERSVGSARVRATLTRANSQFAGHHVDFEIADNHLVPAVDIEPWKC